MNKLRERIIAEKKWKEDNRKRLLEEYRIYLSKTIDSGDIEILQGFREYEEEKYILEG
jgi:hypothetical protein